MSRYSIPPLVTRKEERNRLLVTSGVGGDVLVVQLTKKHDTGGSSAGRADRNRWKCQRRRALWFRRVAAALHRWPGRQRWQCSRWRRHSRDVARESVSWGVVFTFDVAQVRGELRDEVDVAQLSR